MNRKPLIAALAVALAAAAPAARAHGDEHDRTKMHSKPRATLAEEHAFGRQGDPAKATRTVTIGMGDAMRYDPAEIGVKQGETVRFVLRNNGRIRHEMIIGTLAELKEHGELMKKFPNMEHDEPYMAHVEPGGSGQIVWTFTKPGEFSYGCLMPGHFEAGMVGRIVVSKR